MEATLRGLGIDGYCDAHLEALAASVLAAAVLLDEALAGASPEDVRRETSLIRELEGDEQDAFIRLADRLVESRQIAVNPERTTNVAASLLDALRLIRRAAERRALVPSTSSDAVIRPLATNLARAAGPLLGLAQDHEFSPGLRERVTEVESAVREADFLYAEQVARILDEARPLDALRSIELMRLLLEAHRACRRAARCHQYAIDAAS